MLAFAVGPPHEKIRQFRTIDPVRRLDRVLALLELELPQWQLRRIVYDDGDWYCALSRQRALPDWLDQSIEARHSDLALAILLAFVEARRIRTLPSGVSAPIVPRTDRTACVRLSCDNFA